MKETAVKKIKKRTVKNTGKLRIMITEVEQIEGVTGKNLFPEKLKKANTVLKKLVLPESIK